MAHDALSCTAQNSPCQTYSSVIATSYSVNVIVIVDICRTMQQMYSIKSQPAVNEIKTFLDVLQEHAATVL